MKLATTALSAFVLLAACPSAKAVNLGLVAPSCSPNINTCSSVDSSNYCAGVANYVNNCPAICDAATVTVDQCRSEAWFKSFCGDRELRREESVGAAGMVFGTPAKCIAAIKGAGVPAGYTSASAHRPIVLPQAIYGDGWSQAAMVAGNVACSGGSAAGCASGKFYKGVRPVSNTTPLTGDLQGRLKGMTVAADRPILSADVTNLVAGARPTTLENAHAGWRANGAVSASCDEYVFEKYQGYSEFLDATLGADSDPRTVWNVAYNALPAGSDRERRAIGVQRGIRDWTPAGYIFGDDLFPGGLQPKNDFVAYPVSQATLQTVVIGGRVMTVAGTRSSDAWDVQPTLLNADLVAQIGNIRASHVDEHRETFTWHGQAGQTVAGTSDEELERIAQLRHRYQSLIRERNEILASSRQCDVPDLIPAQDIAPDPMDTIDPTWDPSLGMGGAATVMNNALVAKALAGMTGGMSYAISPPPFGGCRYVPTRAHISALNQVDEKIEAVLTNAATLGCFNAGLNKCDWAPSDFASHVKGLLTAERQTAWDECVTMTPTGFGVLATATVDQMRYTDKYGVPQVPSVDGVACGTADYTVSPDKVKRYFDCRRQHDAEVRQTLVDVLGHSGHLVGNAMSQTTSDSFSGGNSIFGVSVAYTSGWNLDGLRRDAVCDSTAGVTGSASVSSQIFGVSANVLSTEAKLGTHRANRMSVRVAGVEIAGVADSTVNTDLNIVQADPNSTAEFFRASQIFSVGPFPVRVSAAASGQAGVAYDASAGCTGSSFNLGGHFRPHVGIKAVASAGVSAVVAEVGIKIDLTLAELSLPLTVTLEGQQGDGGAHHGSLAFNTQLDLTSSYLDGRAALYAEVCYLIGCDSWDYELFSWGGLRTDTQLFNAEFTSEFDTFATR